MSARDLLLSMRQRLVADLAHLDDAIRAYDAERRPATLAGPVTALPRVRKSNAGRPQADVTKALLAVLENCGVWMSTRALIEAVDGTEVQVRNGLKTLFNTNKVAKRPAAGAHGAQAMALEWADIKVLSPRARIALRMAPSVTEQEGG